MKVLIYGFGRMGLTHYTILNSLKDNIEFVIIEPNSRLSALLSKNLNAKFVKDDVQLKESFDLTLITSPPFAHINNLNSSVERGDKIIFIEKPFGGHFNYSNKKYNSDIYIGYVLRHNPIVNYIKNNIQLDGLREVNASYVSNTISKKPKGWRNGKYSGVLNEMGSHLIDLSNYLFDLSDFKVIDSKIKSIISDVDDEVKTCIISNNINYNFYFSWVSQKTRKPYFKFELIFDNKKIIFDQQKIEIISDNFSDIKYVTDICPSVEYYLRGIDFTKQMHYLLTEQGKLCKIEMGYHVNAIMNKILNHENNFRR